MASGLEVTVFLAASGVDWVRKRAAGVVRLNPLDPPLKDMIGNLASNGDTVLVCPARANVRGLLDLGAGLGRSRPGAPDRVSFLLGRSPLPNSS